MSKFRKGGKKVMPAISTASLPDIVFMLLFFFMVTTVMREVTLKVSVTPPTATEVVKMKKKSLVSYIYIGKEKTGEGKVKIQLNGSIEAIGEIQSFVVSERESKAPRDRLLITTSIKADETVKMGIITDVKQELRKANALKINYSTRKAGKSKKY
jgi:biopolymer transport protein ExbD